MRRSVSAVAFGAAVLVACTIAVALITPSVPVQSAGVVYLAGVLAVSTRFGLTAGLLTSLASALAYNYLFLPPRHTLRISQNGGWLALLLFAVVAVVTSRLASAAQDRALEAAQRAREAEMATALATALLAGGEVAEALPGVATLAAQALDAESAEIRLGPGAVRPEAGDLPLAVDGTLVGALRLRGARPDVCDSPAGERVGRALASVLLLARERERLVAERVEAGALRRSDTLKTALLRAVSHDLRSPLQAIRAAGGALALGGLPADEQELVATIQSEAERMDRLVGDVLALSRLQSGAAAPATDWCDVRELVDGAVREVSAHLREARVEVDVPPGIGLVRVDARQLERVLTNLIENALHHGSRAAPVRVVARAGDEGSVLLEVRDDGPGIPDAERERIFEPFFRGGTAEGQGSGLGLAIALGLAEANEVRLELDSEPGRGATFRLVLPSSPARALGAPA